MSVAKLFVPIQLITSICCSLICDIVDVLSPESPDGCRMQNSKLPLCDLATLRSAKRKAIVPKDEPAFSAFRRNVTSQLYHVIKSNSVEAISIYSYFLRSLFVGSPSTRMGRALSLQWK